MGKKKGTAMEPTARSRISAVEAGTEESRREALRKFGRYAAIAPMTMVLLQPREGQAKPKSKKNNNGAKGKDKAKDKKNDKRLDEDY